MRSQNMQIPEVVEPVTKEAKSTLKGEAETNIAKWKKRQPGTLKFLKIGTELTILIHNHPGLLAKVKGDLE